MTNIDPTSKVIRQNNNLSGANVAAIDHAAFTLIMDSNSYNKLFCICLESKLVNQDGCPASAFLACNCVPHYC